MDLKRMLRLPWRKRSGPSVPQRTTDALRQLYHNHQKQKRHWAFIILSALMLMCLFVVMSLFTTPNLWVVAIPFAVVVYSFFQIRRCGRLARMLRQALAVQSQIDKAQKEAEAKAKAEAEAEAAAEAEREAAEAEKGKRIEPVIRAIVERDHGGQGGANGSGTRETERDGKPAPDEQEADDDEAEVG